MRAIHRNGARLFFALLFVHTARGMYRGSFQLFHTWNVGVSLLLLTIASAFLGYVLPWGQISFWGASVITSLIQALPYVGHDIVLWLWGGYSVDNPTLTRFFALHFIIPLVITCFALLHISLLHLTGSTNPLGRPSNVDKVEFHKLFSSKDLLGFTVVTMVFLNFVLLAPYVLGDPENFIIANPLSTPIHIQPEWYFLFAYAILRSIPNKLGGVLALAASVLVLYTLPLCSITIFSWLIRTITIKLIYWRWLGVTLLLTWIGIRPVEDPYIIIGQLLTYLYFSFLFLLLPLALIQHRVLKNFLRLKKGH